jgi:hypothetical protein
MREVENLEAGLSVGLGVAAIGMINVANSIGNSIRQAADNRRVAADTSNRMRAHFAEKAAHANAGAALLARFHLSQAA